MALQTGTLKEKIYGHATHLIARLSFSNTPKSLKKKQKKLESTAGGRKEENPEDVRVK